MSNTEKKGGEIRRILKYMRPYRKTFFACLVIVILLIGLELVKPVIIGDAIDRWITGNWEPGENVRERFMGLMTGAALYLVCLIARYFCERAQQIKMQKMGQDIVCDMRDELFEHTLGLDNHYFDVTPVGKIVTRLTNDVESINEVFSNILVQLFRNTIKIIGLAIVMLSLNYRMALYSFILLPLVMVMTILFRTLSRKAYQQVRTRLTNLNTYLSEHLGGMKVIQLFGREKAKYEEFREKNQDLYQAGVREMMVFGLFRPGIYFMSVLALAIVIHRGGNAVIDGAISIGTLYVFIDYIQTFFQPIQDLAEQFSTLQSAIASAEKIFTLLDEKATITEPENLACLSEIHGKIEFKHVCFAYEGEEWVLRDVSFVIEPGQKVAFVGATGAGKTSILSLIGRYYEIQKGQILLDGVDIRDISLEQLRKSIGQVQQDVFLFTGTVKGNIRLMNDDISDEEILHAAEEVNADRFIRNLPGKYEQPVAERGATFSAGQRQLISFARTLAFDPTILILDEATANIDTETEQWIQEAVERLMRGRTTIMVAHRLSTIQHADRIIVMHHGKIRESGTHQELLKMDGIYKKLYQLQLA